MKALFYSTYLLPTTIKTSCSGELCVACAMRASDSVQHMSDRRSANIDGAPFIGLISSVSTLQYSPSDTPL